MPRFDPEAAQRLVEIALAEDLGPGDVTTSCLPLPRAPALGTLVGKGKGVLAGAPLAELVFRQIDPGTRLAWRIREGDEVLPGAEIARLEGPAFALLAGERTALNFVQRLAGIATLTREFVRRVRGTGAAILDTRKTTPGWRSLEKYAVALGGGENHRRGLFDQALFKENHRELARGLEPLGGMVRRARERTGSPVEVEVRNLEELREGIEAGAEILLLDNMTLEEMRAAVARVRGLPSSRRPLIEASGGITLETVRRVALTGVDRISVGALTHSAPALDLALYIEGRAV